MTAPPLPARAGRRRRVGVRGAPWLFVVPALLVYGVVVLYPTAAGGLYAFTDWTGRAGDANFVGLDNFRRLFNTESARSALVNTLTIAAACTIVQTAAGLGLALALNTRLRSRNVLRTLFFASALLPPVIIGFLWQYVLTPTGPLNTALSDVGLGALRQNWLGDGSLALWSVIGVIIWQNAGLTMVIYLAGLQGIPPEVHEAAAIDGAGPWQRFRSVTLPLLLPATTIALSLTLIGSLKLFDQVFAMTGGGPGYATETLSVVMYKEAFVSGEFGYSAAIALVLTMIVFAFAMIQLRTLRRFEVDS
ncbi:carbohydrate ABC transporter permease [Streptomyces profundus]|uniref:carbohydrate ABC transporter permease n=1 Tax=Streptomyces profundus TaxID=2867410 RepID=UPI001D168BB4|nr:sugar ABC transporter permease [Streptomyces sp. MA3_2.13]